MTFSTVKYLSEKSNIICYFETDLTFAMQPVIISPWCEYKKMVEKNNFVRKSTAIVSDRKINFNCQQSQNRMKIIQKAKPASAQKIEEKNRNQTEQEKS